MTLDTPISPEPENDTLYKLLTSLEMADNELIELDPEQHKDLLQRTELKIDAYKYIQMKYESRIAEIQAEMDELATVKKVLNNRLDGMKKLMLWVLKTRNVKEFAGNKYKIKVIERKNIVVSEDELKPQHYIEFPDLVNREYSWKKKEFNKAFKANPDGPLSKFGRIEIKESVQFDLRKGIDNE